MSSYNEKNHCQEKAMVLFLVEVSPITNLVSGRLLGMCLVKTLKFLVTRNLVFTFFCKIV